MVLQSNQQNGKWIRMVWKCTFDMRWPNILYAVKAVMGTFENAKVLAGQPGSGSAVIDPNDNPDEQPLLNLQGKSRLFDGNISIAFYTNTKEVVITIPTSLGFPNDYAELSKAMGQFVDTLELRMFTAK